MTRPLRIAIVGYGTAGQAAALFLAAQGHALSIFEQAEKPGPVGAGFLLQPTGLAVLSRLGLQDRALQAGQRIERLYGCTARGRMVMDMHYAQHAPDCFGLGMSRGALFALLRDAYDGASTIHTGTRIASVDAESGVLLDDSGEHHGPFDLVVAADGAHSRLREGMQPLVRRQTVYPWGAMWCLLPATGWAHHDSLQQRYNGTGEMVGLLPVGERPGHEGRWLTYFFSLPGNQVDTFDDAALVRMRERVGALWPEAMPLLAGIETPSHLQRARYRDVVLRRSSHGKLVFIGDAAHAMSPQLGQGVNMALLDAEAMADALVSCQGLDQALHAYARQRRSHLAVYQRLSRWLTPLFQSHHRLLGPLRDVSFGPSGKLPLATTQMLRILTGTKRNWWR